MLKKKFLLGVGITSATEEEILEYILQSLKKSAEKHYIVTPNPEILVYASKHNDFQTILNNARLALCDGIGVFWAGKFLGRNFEQRITGVDLLENLCKAASKQPITVGFLGGRDKIAEKTADCLQKKYPRLKVVFAGEEWPGGAEVALAGPAAHSSQGARASLSFGTERTARLGSPPLASPATGSSRHKNATMEQFSNETIDVLFVAFGFPKQEEWMAKNLPKIPVRIMVGVGGAFDYISGVIPRAPKLVRDFGFEWLYRLFRQPWRLKRQFALLEFVVLVLKEKMGKKQDML
ncbi:MAG: WecB/TagA/CpsF family glycosyltransferase [Candidatus Levybacteria bacterium]|nr:WecB/TagA/CpsF family glycosyltransferase [Candidatus Levybacteria bacterium]